MKNGVSPGQREEEGGGWTESERVKKKKIRIS